MQSAQVHITMLLTKLEGAKVSALAALPIREDAARGRSKSAVEDSRVGVSRNVYATTSVGEVIKLSTDTKYTSSLGGPDETLATEIASKIEPHSGHPSCCGVLRFVTVFSTQDLPLSPCPYRNHRGAALGIEEKESQDISATSMIDRNPRGSRDLFFPGRTDACGLLDPCKLATSQQVVSRPAAISVQGSDKVPKTLVKVQKPAAVARHTDRLVKYTDV